MRIHFIGIGGTGMGALANLLKQAGHEVRGSDEHLYPPMSTQLLAAEIPVFVGFAASNLDWQPDCVVVGNVCRKDHLEVLAAQDRGIALESFPSLLAKTLLVERTSLVVAGTHGKTTTTSLLAWLLEDAGLSPSFLVGGIPVNFQTPARVGRGTHIVLEGDEYDTAFFDKGSKFLHYRPAQAILTGVEFDHADIFADERAVRAAFEAFVALIPAQGDLVVNSQDEGAMAVAKTAVCRLHPYAVIQQGESLPEKAEYVAVLPSLLGRRTTFEVFERGQSLGEFATQLVGRHNVGNAVAALAVARLQGAPPEALRMALSRFRGVKRRQELMGLAQGVRVIDDFGHHPTAVNLTIEAVRRRFPEHALHVCFEPRSASSRRNVFQAAYADSFSAATYVYIGPLYHPESIPESTRLDPGALAQALSQKGTPAAHYSSVDALFTALAAKVAPGDAVLLLSSGNFENLGRRLLHHLGNPVTFAETGDRPTINALLATYDLPEVTHLEQVETLVLWQNEQIVGCVNLELCGDVGFLFGLAVLPTHRGLGLGFVLSDYALRRVKHLGLRKVVLASARRVNFLMDKLGFTAISREDVPAEIQATANFKAAALAGHSEYFTLDFEA